MEELDSAGHVTTAHVFHGNVTSQTLVTSASDVRINVCYSANTFAARSTHIVLRAIGAYKPLIV